MQLILDAETTVDLKTKMSLNEENLEKCVSDILPGIKNEGISNGDVINGKEEHVELKENNDVDKIDQSKESIRINSVEVEEIGTTISKNADIERNNVDTETSQDCKNKDILNGNNADSKEAVAISEPIDQSHNISESIERENNTIEKDTTDNESGTVNTELNHDSLSENNVSKHLSESESFVTEPIAVGSNIESELIALQSSDMGNTDTESIRDITSMPTNDSIAESSECVDIKKENDETAVSDSKQTNLSDNCDIKKEVDENNKENNLMTDPTVAIKEELHDNIASNPEINDNDMKLIMMKTEIEENAPVSKGTETMETDTTENVPVSKGTETMETDNTENDTSDENIDLIRLDVQDNIWDKPNDSDVLETRTEDYRNTDPVEKDNFKTDNVTNMDVDESANHSNETEIKEVDLTPAENTSKSKDSEFIETDKTKTVTTSDLDLNSSDDAIVNLVDDKEKITVNLDKSESIQIIVDDDKPIINCDDDTDIVQNVEKSVTKDPQSIDDIIDLDENVPNETHVSKLSSEESKKQQDNDKGSVDSKPMEPVLKLSNTLDILSDDEEEQVQKSSNTDSKCINIEDDDDVMLIDDDTSGNENRPEPTKEHDVEKEPKPASPIESVKMDEDNENPNKKHNISGKDAAVSEKEIREPTPIPDFNEKIEENKLQIETQKPLIPENFLKTCKKNLVDMTREELEEFCILKLVESILDRSNLSEIKNKLKVLTQNIEDYKKKALMLSKQNRDLQVVLKSIQDDVKKSSEAPIVPLKITRSVGMQVLMADKPDKRRRTGISIPNTNKQLRTTAMQNPRPQKPPTQPIPVPRLVPANNTAIKSPNTQQVNTSKVTSPLPNGIKTVSPVQKAEKRTHNRMQSVTVDLTDDEPPPKVVNRTQNPVPPVRLVPSQNLLATPRTPTVNSPRKVYIPISGPQGQNVRPGQTIMLKTVPTASPRQRVPPPHMVRMPQSIRMARPQGLRHPAPLPECMKQYQPPNWKALPPAPDLKLAKVENGIVISWKIEGYQEDSYEEIASYQLYAYQETTSPPNTALWKKIGDVKALPLPMACTLTQFMAGYKYYFAVRAVDIRSRLGPFSLPGSILLLNKM